mmetsp:Transcript_31622/g.63871  ORF Transcript_31622/g.63871 Transcript_31622/m.63871 type:complete len:369 (+) Transcript_31622:122-1228(+)
MEPVKQTFPFKLYHTIEWASDSEFSSALSWSPSGNAFVVHDREVVVEHIIPKFFDHKKWRSFTRQLNLWGFKRELRGPDTEGERYYHQFFNRGKLDELQLIQRTEIKRRSSKKQLSSYDSGHPLSLSQQISAMTANHNDGFKIQGANPPQTGDITQGASFLTGLKAQSMMPGGVPVPAPGGGPMPNAANCFNMQMQAPGQMSNQMSNMMSYKTSSLPPSMQSQMMQSQMMNPQMMNPQMLQSQQMLMQQQMMRQQQPQMFQGYPSGGNWNPNELNRGMLNQQLAAMTTNMNGGMNNMYNSGNNNNMSGFNMMQAGQMGCNLNDASHATLVSVSDSLRGSITSRPQLDVSEEGKVNDGGMPSQPLPRAA